MKIAVYVSNDETLGHITRISSILKHLKKTLKNNVEILIFHSGSPNNTWGLDRFGKLINLPYAISKKHFKLTRRVFLRPGVLSKINKSHMLERRQLIIKNSLKNFKPDIFLTEYFPFGLEFWTLELIEIVKFVKENLSTKIVSSVGYPSYRPITSCVFDLYDRIFFHYPKTEISYYIDSLKAASCFQQASDFSACLKKYSGRIRHTGYIIESEKINISKRTIRKDLKVKKSQKLVVVSRGGGVINDRIIFQSILAARILKDVFFFISAGPATQENEFKLFSRQCSGCGNIKITRWQDNFLDFLNAADLSVNMCGYNTIAKILWLKKQSVTVPLDSIEQAYRAKMLADNRFAVILKPNELSVDTITFAIKNMLDNPLKPKAHIEKISFNGVEETVKGLRCLM